MTVPELYGYACTDRPGDLARLDGQWAAANLDAIARELWAVTADEVPGLRVCDRRIDWRTRAIKAAKARRAAAAERRQHVAVLPC